MYKKNMKRIIIFLIIVFASIICYLIYNTYITGKKKENDVTVIEEKSYLSDFEVIDDTVHIYCVISLKNKSNSSKEVKLIGDFKNDVESGLLKERALEAHFMEEDTYTLTVDANSEVMYVKVEFVGKFAGNSQMSSRSLPPMEVVNTLDR